MRERQFQSRSPSASWGRAGVAIGLGRHRTGPARVETKSVDKIKAGDDPNHSARRPLARSSATKRAMWVAWVGLGVIAIHSR